MFGCLPKGPFGSDFWDRFASKNPRTQPKGSGGRSDSVDVVDSASSIAAAARTPDFHRFRWVFTHLPSVTTYRFGFFLFSPPIDKSLATEDRARASDRSTPRRPAARRPTAAPPLPRPTPRAPQSAPILQIQRLRLGLGCHRPAPARPPAASTHCRRCLRPVLIPHPILSAATTSR
jgi:hypothetical protein